MTASPGAEIDFASPTVLWTVRDGMRLRALDYPGVDPAVLIIPGITSPAATWGFVVRALQLPQRVIVPDARGRGSSDKPPAGYSLEDYASDLHHWTKRLNLHKPILLGHSMGARVVTEYDVRWPGIASGLIVVDPPMSGPGRDPYPIPLEFYLKQLDSILAGASADSIKAGSPTWTDEQVRDRLEWLPTCSVEAISESHARFHTEDFFERWAKVTAPTLFLRGGSSLVVKEAGYAEARKINPRAEYQVVANAGHMIPWDNLAGFVAATRAFVAEVAPHVAAPTTVRESELRAQSDDEFFRARGFSRKIGFGRRPVVLVIDVVKAFTDPRRPLGSNLDTQITAIGHIIDVARSGDIPIMFSTVTYDEKDSKDAGIWALKQKGVTTLRAGTDGPQLDSRLKFKESDSILVKKYASCFFGTDLISKLLSVNADTLILTGCTTSGCVRATAVDACQIGLRPMVVREAVGDRSQAAHEQSLFDLNAKYADVVSLTETLKYLTALSARG